MKERTITAAKLIAYDSIRDHESGEEKITQLQLNKFPSNIKRLMADTLLEEYDILEDFYFSAYANEAIEIIAVNETWFIVNYYKFDSALLCSDCLTHSIDLTRAEVDAALSSRLLFVNRKSALRHAVEFTINNFYDHLKPTWEERVRKFEKLDENKELN